MSDNYTTHRGRLAPNDAAFIRSRMHHQNIWWAPRKRYWIAVVLAWLLNVTSVMEADSE